MKFNTFCPNMHFGSVQKTTPGFLLDIDHNCCDLRYILFYFKHTAGMHELSLTPYLLSTFNTVKITTGYFLGMRVKTILQ